MKRLFIVAGFLALGTLLMVLSFLGRTNRTSGENMVRIRAQTPTQPPEVNFNRGRIGSEAPMALGLRTWTGLLVDAGCSNREEVTQEPTVASRLAIQPEGAMQTPQSGGGAAGVGVSAQALESERADAVAQQVPDLRSRNMDPACAVTSLTRSFALFLPDGEMKNLDYGGDTKAAVVFEGSAQGQAVLNGKVMGDKPRVSVTGVERGDHIEVQDIRIL